MIFVFGGAYQGMEEYAREQLGVQTISAIGDDGMWNENADAVVGLERFVLACVRRGESAVEAIKALRPKWENSVLIGLDFSCGLVPMDAETRAWREENGRLNSYLAQCSEHTVRMFCGIGQVLK